ncbi:MAG: 3-phosphoshikimate 1-carboxyvinyltransferase [Candidatus Desulfofervidaceae bacterium]|nr:3-phosphoshikimate 1-carboxyvinyltransferase [Candidatus Desulfofervidaceae bacterium]
MEKKDIIPLKEGIKLTITVPGSKSLTHRALITASLAKGTSVLTNILLSEDTLLTTEALRQMGTKIEIKEELAFVEGTGGKLQAPAEPIFLSNSGTSMRLLTAVSAIGKGRFVLSGNERMQERPIQPLLDALHKWGIKAYSLKGNGCPPVVIETDGLKGGATEIDPTISSQFLSGLLLAAPYAEQNCVIIVTGKLASRPYVDLTLQVMADFGVSVENKDYRSFGIKRGYYQGRRYTIEGDCSTASYFWAAAAILKGEITVCPIRADSKQADIGFVKILERMGCKSEIKEDGITVKGRTLKGITVDMNTMPDIVPTLAIVAAFAKGETEITNVPHLRHKECDRLHALATELGKMGIKVVEREDGLIIKGGKPHGAVIETYNDHRIAMSFAIAGLKVPGVQIVNPLCVKKSFPKFWEAALFS